MKKIFIIYINIYLLNLNLEVIILKNSLFNELVKCYNSGRLTTSNLNEIKKKYDPKEVDVVCACVINDPVFLQDCIDKKYELSICNDEFLRYTIYNGYIEVSRLLIKMGVSV